MKTLLKLFIVILPWSLKRYFLQKCFGYKLSKTAHIGLSFAFPKYLEMHDGAEIGHLNVIINCDKVVVGENSSIGRQNWITGFPTGTDSPHFAHDKNRRSELIIGRESAITKNHHFDCTSPINIGDFVTIGGYNSQFLTHAIDIYEGRQDSHPITIENYTFVSINCTILSMGRGYKFAKQFLLGGGCFAQQKLPRRMENICWCPSKTNKRYSA